MSRAQDFTWNEGWSAEGRALLKKHFNGQPSRLYPSLSETYYSKSITKNMTRRAGAEVVHRIDHRVAMKNNAEYHGLENHAWQYHAVADYQLAYEYFLMAATWRADNEVYFSDALGGSDEGHQGAIDYCLRHALYNRALSQRVFPDPWATMADFGIDPLDHGKHERAALAVLEEVAQATLRRSETKDSDERA